MADTLPELKAQIAAAEAKYGDLPKGLLEKLADIESKGGRNLVNPKSSARGPFQFMKDTGPEFGLHTEADRMDFAKSTDAAARLLLRNKKDLERQIGRTATPGELYLAHQQGATGAAKLLKNPNAKAADIVGDPERIRLNGGDPKTMTAGAFATKWTSKIDGGAATAPAKKSPSLGSLGALPQGITPEKDFYDFNGADLAKLDAGSSALSRLGREPPKVNQTLADVPATPISKLSQLVTGTPEQAAERMETPADEARPDRKDTAILAGLSTLHKTAARLAEPLASIQAVEDEETAPSGIQGVFKRGVESGLQNMSADQEYFGAIIDTIAGNEKGAKSRIFNAQQYEEYSAKALQGMQSFEEFTNAPTFDGFITQVVSAAGQVAPSAVESIASALTTGGMYSLGKTALSQGSKVVAKTLVKDLVAKKAKGVALDKAEDGILDGLYKNFKTGALAGAFGSEYKMMSGSAFSEFGDAGIDMNAENALKSLLIGAPQAAIGVGGEYAILKMLGNLATKKATRSAKTSILKKFAQEVTRAGLKAGALEGATEVGQEAISVGQRALIDPTFTMQDAQMRIGQAAFAGFFGGGLFGSAAAGPAAGVSAVRSAKIIDGAKKFLKDAAEARVETEVTNETTGVDDAALAGVSTEEASTDVDAQVEVLLNPDAPKNAVFAALDPNAPPAVEPGQSHTYELEDGPNKGEKVTVGHIPGKGLIMSQDPAVVDEVLTTAEIGGDVDAAIGAAIGYVGGKDGNEVVRVKNKDGAVVDEAVTNEENKLASATRAEQIASATPGAQVDIVPVEQALEERSAKASLDRKEFNVEAAAARALMDTIGEEEVSGDNYEAEANKKADFVEKKSPVKKMSAKATKGKTLAISTQKGEMLFENSSLTEDELDTIIFYPNKGKEIIAKLSAEEQAFWAEAEAAEIDGAGFYEPAAQDTKLSELDQASVRQYLMDNMILPADMLAEMEKDNYSNEKDLEVIKYLKQLDAGMSSDAPKLEVTKALPSEQDTASDEATIDAELKRRIEEVAAMLAERKIKNATSDVLEEAMERSRAFREDVIEDLVKAKKIKPMSSEDIDAIRGIKRQEPTNDDADPVVDEEQATMFDELAATYAEADAENAVEIKQYNERNAKNTEEQEAGYQTQIDGLWTDLEKVVDDDTVLENYRQFKDRMPVDMIKKLIELNTQEFDGVQPYFDVSETTLEEGGAREKAKAADGETLKGKLAITRRDSFPNAETIVTRDAVKNVLEQVQNMPTPQSVLRKTVGKARTPSMFWLVNRKTKKAYQLNGTPKTERAKGRTGIDALAQAGVKLNASTKQGLSGKGVTKLQSRAQGFKTMWKALIDAGYDLKVGKYPTGLVPFDQNKLPTEAMDEVVSVVDGQRYTINDMLDAASPFEESKTSQKGQGNPDDEKNYHEELRGNRWVKVMNGPKTLDSIDPNDIREEIATDGGPEAFALSEDRKKRINDDELAANEKETRRRAAVAAAVVSNAKEEARNSDGEVSAADLIEEGLDPLPDGARMVVRKVGNVWQVELSGPNIPRQPFTNKSKKMAIARAHQRAVSMSESAPVQHNTLAIESVHTTQKSRDAHPEIAGVPAPKNQISIKTSGVTSSGTNKSETHGKIGPLTQKILATALSKFNFHKPVIVMTIKHLEDNFEALTGPGGRYEGGRAVLMTAIDEMSNPNLPQNPARLIPGKTQHLILLRDDADVSLDINGDRIIAYDDAEIGAVLAHEIGHIVFKQEFESMVEDDPLRKALWKAYVADAKSMKEDGTDVDQYTNDKAGFEEWYSDQVMAFIYRKAQTTKGLVAGYFTRVANAIHDFFREVNKALGGRLKSSSQKVEGFTVKTEDGKKKQGNVPDYFEDISRKNQEKRKVAINHAKELAAAEIKATEAAAKAAAEAAAVEEALRLAREDDLFQVDESMQIKNMFLNLRNRIPAGAQQRMQTAGRAIMSSGTWGNLGTKIKNIAYASTDFMGAKEHGPAGQALKTFFGTLSQSSDKLGWNKRELFAQNLWNNALADIFGFNDKTNPADWDSRRTRDIMVEAMNEDLTDAQLSTPEAKAIRKLYTKIEQTYLKKPGGARAGYYIPNFRPRANYGGPRMWNIAKIAKNEAAFVAWLAPKLKQTGNPQQRAKDIFDTMIHRTKNQVELIEREVDRDLTARNVANPSPALRAALEFRESMRDQAVMEVRDKILRKIRRGAFSTADVITELQVTDPTDADLTALAALPADEQADGLKKYWMRRTEKIRLTPGMDPALKRELADEVKTIDAYNADPNDPNGWLLPPALAHSQYMHYIARRVEFEKMGIERGGRTGADYIIEQLDAIPDEHRMNIDAAIMANLGKFGENMSPLWRTINSVGSVMTVFTTLLFTTLTSLTDPAGIFVRMKEFNDLGTYINGLKTTLGDREFQELARSVGVVTGRTQEHMMIGQGELDYANQTARKMTDGFFRYTGLEWYTKFMRSFAVGMGREFLMKTALKQDFDARDERYLAELGLTRDDVRDWLDHYQMFNTPSGEKVRAAIARFADESIIRPDASQRPTWASNPYLQMVWQLKSYYYGFGKTVLGGLGREMKNRYTEDGNFNGAAQTALLYAGTIIPLTMMGMASRDWLKWLFQLALPGVDETPSTSMKLDTTGYMWEIFKRSGTMGPFALGLTTMEAFKFEGIAAPFTANVPMFDLFDDTIFDGDLSRPLPVINNIK